MAAKSNIGPWVPENAIQAFSGLADMASNQEYAFIQRLFETKDLKEFWSDFSKGGYQFFSEFLYRIIRGYRRFQKSQNLPVRREDALEGLSTLYDRFREVEKILEDIRKQGFVEVSAFDDLLSKVEYCQFQALPVLSFQIEQAAREPKKNPHRPLTRQRGGAMAEPAYYGRLLYFFFLQDHIQKDWKKSPTILKRHICDIVNVLLDCPDDPLTVSALNGYTRNSHKLL